MNFVWHKPFGKIAIIIFKSASFCFGTLTDADEPYNGRNKARRSQRLELICVAIRGSAQKKGKDVEPPDSGND